MVCDWEREVNLIFWLGVISWLHIGSKDRHVGICSVNPGQTGSPALQTDARVIKVLRGHCVRTHCRVCERGTWLGFRPGSLGPGACDSITSSLSPVQQAI